MHIELYLLECYPPSALDVHVLMLFKPRHFCVSHFSIQFPSHCSDDAFGRSCYTHSRPRLGEKDFHGLVFANKRTDWLVWHNGNSIQWHMYACTHHQCGPVINLSSLVQLIWLKSDRLGCQCGIGDMACVHDVSGFKHATSELCKHGFLMFLNSLAKNKPLIYCLGL